MAFRRSGPPPRLERRYAQSAPLHRTKSPKRRQLAQRLGEVAHCARADREFLRPDETPDQVIVRATSCINAVLLGWPRHVGQSEPSQLPGRWNQGVGDGLAEAAVLVGVGTEGVVVDVKGLHILR